VISEFLRTIARCPACRTERLDDAGGCPRCRRVYPALEDGTYLDLRPPPDTFSELTEYAEEEFHHREGKLRPLFLSARVKRDMMRKMLRSAPGDSVLDIGCGNGRFAYFERPECRELVGIDAGAHFAPEPRKTVDLARGDVRLLPFADASFDKAYTLDVLEHLTEDGALRMLSEARRVLRPG
jgi:SAM-dependent methyltransferase